MAKALREGGSGLGLGIRILGSLVVVRTGRTDLGLIGMILMDLEKFLGCGFVGRTEGGIAGMFLLGMIILMGGLDWTPLFYMKNLWVVWGWLMVGGLGDGLRGFGFYLGV